jgi:hypothetical protein
MQSSIPGLSRVEESHGGQGGGGGGDDDPRSRLQFAGISIQSKKVLLMHVVRATSSFDGEGSAVDVSAVFDMIRENPRLLATTLQFVKNRIKVAFPPIHIAVLIQQRMN